MTRDQLEACLNVVGRTSSKGGMLGIKYCVTEDDRALECVGGSTNPLCVTQVVPLKLVLSELQLRTAALLTVEAFVSGTNISSKPEIEYLLYLGGSRQIRQTLERVRRYMGKPYLVITFCSEPGETQARKLPEDLDCRTVDLGGVMNPSLRDAAEFYGSPRKTLEGILKDALTKMNYLKLQTRKSPAEHRTT
ncbi:MAG: KEOPS complex subunit Cgi121 [Zestosphaera sp.]